LLQINELEIMTATKSDLRLTVVMTSYNEVKTVAKAYESAKRISVESKELIVVDNSSTDGTREILRELQLKDTDTTFIDTTFILQDRNLDLAYSVQTGIRLAKGRYTYIHHADDEYDSSYVQSLLELAEADELDMVLGSRLSKNRPSAFRLVLDRPGWMGTFITTALINYWYGKQFNDIIGSRLYRTEALRKDPIASYGKAFDFEIVSSLFERKSKIKEALIGYTPRECQADKKVRWHHLIPAVWVMVRVRYFDRWIGGRGN
jgi:glycosyltransferase involved in cell wall biosynthesis